MLMFIRKLFAKEIYEYDETMNGSPGRAAGAGRRLLLLNCLFCLLFLLLFWRLAGGGGGGPN